MPIKHPFPGVKGRLEKRLGELGLGLYTFIGCLVATGLVGLAALFSREPMLFPSLAPTVLMFFERAQQPSACPRNTLIGHGIAIIAGWISLAIFGLLAAPSVLIAGVTWARVGAAALSVAATGFTKHLLRVPHPPAGASALIVSLGFLTTWPQLLSMAAGIVLLTIVSWCANYLLGVPMPLWGPFPQEEKK